MAQLGSGVYIRPISSGWGWGPPANMVSPHCGLVAGWVFLEASPTFGENIERPQVHVDQGMARNKQFALSYSPALTLPSREWILVVGGRWSVRPTG